MKQQLETAIAYRKREREALLAQYGTGVRPGWVSTDLSLLDLRISELEAELAALEPAHDR